MISEQDRATLLEMGYTIGEKWIPYPEGEEHFYEKNWCDVKVKGRGDEIFGPIWPNALHFRIKNLRFKEEQISAIRYYGGHDEPWDGNISSLIEKLPQPPELPSLQQILEET